MIEESQPLSGSTMAFETRYDVSTQVLSSVPAERLPAIWGSATLAMLVSSTSMNVASVTVRAMIHGLTAGRHSAVSFMVMDAALMFLLNPDLRRHRHPRTQFVSLQLAGLKVNLNRDALDYLDVIAGRVFW